MNDMSVTYNPGLVGGALRKGLQQPDAALSSRSELDGAAKAAIILLSMGPDVAANLLKHFSPVEAQRISSLLASVRSLNRDTLIEVLEDFKWITEHQKEIPFDPKAFVQGMLQKFAEDGEDPNIFVPQGLASNVPALELLSQMTPDALYPRLRDEHPQVTAILLAMLPSDLSASVIEKFAPDVRDELIMRMAMLDRVEPHALTELNDMIERSLADQTLGVGSGIGGSEPVAEILSHFGGSTPQGVIDKIRSMNPELATSIEQKMFNFEDFVRIAPSELVKVLSAVNDMELMARALKGTTNNIREFFYANMPKSRVEKIMFEMEGLPPLNVQKIEEAQRTIVRIAKDLANADKVNLDRSGLQARMS